MSKMHMTNFVCLLVVALGGCYVQNTNRISSDQQQDDVFVAITKTNDAKGLPHLVFSLKKPFNLVSVCEATPEKENVCAQPVALVKAVEVGAVRDRLLFSTPSGLPFGPGKRLLVSVDKKTNPAPTTDTSVKYVLTFSPKIASWKALAVAGENEDMISERTTAEFAKLWATLAHAGNSLGILSVHDLHPDRMATLANLDKTAKKMAPAKEDACLFSFNYGGATAAGQKVGVRLANGEILESVKLREIINAACPSNPVVVLVSGPMSGAMIDGLKNPNTIVLTSDSATNAGLHAPTDTQSLGHWDGCLMSESLKAKTIRDLSGLLEACVTAKQAAPEFAANRSVPQKFFGADVVGLTMFSMPATLPPATTGVTAVNFGANDFALLNHQNKPVMLSSLMGNAQFMLLENARPDCPACKDFAAEVELKKNLFSGKCALTTIVADIGAWRGFIADKPFAASHAYVGDPEIVKRNFDPEFAAAFPSMIVIDRNGKVVAPAQNNSAMPEFIKANCN